MQLILKPRSDPELDEIIVTEKLFAVGRSEPPFNRYSKSTVAKLSKRHARLFAQDGQIYVADLGSLNGTECNDEPVVNAPKAIADGDMLSFGGLIYEVDIIVPPASTTADRNHEIRLVLTPERLGEALAPIVITSFPFLINKNSDVFERYKESLPEQVSFLSRRHAHVFVAEDQLRIEDLGSTNGTYVNGAQLDEHAKELMDGDLIAFGSDQLVYRAHVLRSTDGEKTQAPEQLPEIADSTKTIFVDSPTSFIDVYFKEGNDAAELDGDVEPDVPGADEASSDDSLFKQLKHAFFGTNILGPRTRQVLVLLLVGAVGASGVAYWLGLEQREIEALVADEKFEAALRKADALIARGNDEAHVRSLATQAMVGFSLPGWVRLYQQGDFPAAQEVLDDARLRGRHNSGDDVLIDVLQWGADLRQFLLTRRTAVDFRPFEDASRIQKIMAAWNKDAQQYTRELGLFSPLQPAFGAVYETIFRDLSSLRKLALDTKPLHEVGVSITDNLSEGRSGEVVRGVETLLEEQRNFKGATALREDLQTFEQLETALSEREWLQAYTLVKDHKFHTEPFQTYASQLEHNVLPDAETLERYQAALEMWQAGEFDRSEQLLQQLAQTKWPEIAQRRIDEQQALRVELAGLLELRDSPDYPERLFTFYARLDEREDVGLVEQLREDFVSHAQAARVNAADNFKAAQTSWEQYKNRGRIQTQHRFDNLVSDEFVQLAELLRNSASLLERALLIHEQLALDVPSAWQALANTLRTEISLQRSLLTNVQVVSEAIRQRKLDALPE